MKTTIEKTVGQIAAECKEGFRLKEVLSGSEIQVKAIAGTEDCKPGDLVFVSDAKQIKEVLARKPAAMVISATEAAKLGPQADTAIIASDNPGVSYALMRQKYTDRDYTEGGFERIHPTAIIHESVKIPDDAKIGPYTVIERGAVIGKGVVLQSHVVIEFEAVIGDGTVIQHMSVIGFQCKIGKNCLILPHSVIGSEGFGYAQDENFHHYRIPQTGNVVIGDDVTIGALNAIDRATFTSTIFRDNVICDNICHTAHNCDIGENSILLTGWKMAGSSKTGKRVIASGDAMVKDHVSICDDVVLVHRAGVIADITEKGMYAQSPSQPMREYVKNFAAYQKLGDMAKEFKELKKQVAELMAAKGGT